MLTDHADALASFTTNGYLVVGCDLDGLFHAPTNALQLVMDFAFWCQACGTVGNVALVELLRRFES